MDRERVFVGSFNFDPRSERLNTELGFVIDSRALAGMIDAAFNERVPDEAYEVRLDERGRLAWVERCGEQVLRHDREPGAPLWRRALAAVLARLPIESLL